MSRLAWLIALMSITGCQSISSTLLNRTDDDFFHGNSNGEPTCGDQARPYKGVPITVRVPTHLDVVVKQTVWIGRDENKRLYQIPSEHPHVFLETKLIETDKVFTVDPKRPAAGTMKYTLDFGDRTSVADNSQYFKTIAYKITDQTINEVNASLQTLLPLLQRSSTTAKKTGAGDTIDDLIVAEEHTVIAWRRFDLDAFDFEAQVQCFVESVLPAHCAVAEQSLPVLTPQR
jgi:hypothetical protein